MIRNGEMVDILEKGGYLLTLRGMPKLAVALPARRSPNHLTTVCTVLYSPATVGSCSSSMLFPDEALNLEDVPLIADRVQVLSQ